MSYQPGAATGSPAIVEPDLCFSFFAGVSYLQILRGRCGALVDELTRRGHRVFYYDYPPVNLRGILMRRLRERRSLPVQIRPHFNASQNPTLIPAPIGISALKFTGCTRRIEQLRLRRVLAPQITLPLRLEPARRHVAIVGNPWWRQFLNDQRFDLVCYDLVDHFEVFSGRFNYRRFEAWEREQLQRSDLVFYTAERLREYANSRTSARLVSLPNAGNAEFFRRQAAALPLPADIASIPRPRAGFVGAIFRWLDFDLLAHVMKALPEVHFVFIGPVEDWGLLSALTGLGNFHHLGLKPYEQVPAYLNAFNVCLCPFKTDDVGQAVDPVKMYEYFALGKPVVASRIYELAKLQPMTYVADHAEEFASGIRQALAESGSELAARRVEFALENSWARRVDRLIAEVRQELKAPSR